MHGAMKCLFSAAVKLGAGSLVSRIASQAELMTLAQAPRGGKAGAGAGASNSHVAHAHNSGGRTAV